MSTEIISNEVHLPAIRQTGELSVDVVLGRLEKVQDLMRRAMVKGVDYGQIPGTKSKLTLLKPGAEKLCVMFRLAPRYTTVKQFESGHLTVETTCQILDGNEGFLGEASAMASTRESKWAYRKSERTCPECGKAALIKESAQYVQAPNVPGWLCWKKKDGCGYKFPPEDIRIIGQQVGRVPNEDLADSYNTVLRIAEKRAYIAAVRLVTGSSALFDEEGPEGSTSEVKEDGEIIHPLKKPEAPKDQGPTPEQFRENSMKMRKSFVAEMTAIFMEPAITPTLQERAAALRDKMVTFREGLTPEDLDECKLNWAGLHKRLWPKKELPPETVEEIEAEKEIHF